MADLETKRTPLYSFHVEAGAKMVPFAGYQMPVNYPQGIIKEHLHTRSQAGLFDVSHMGQIRVKGTNAAQQLERLMPVDIAGLNPGEQRYGLLLNESGGVLDDLMVARWDEDEFILVVNAACKDNDFNHLSQTIGSTLDVEMYTDKSLLALQGPQAATVMHRLGNDLSDMRFMQVRQMEISGIHCRITRSGYTGEDGFEISVHDDQVSELTQLLLGDESVQWVGLGARDSLRLEAGLCLYGHELNEQTTPIEANLLWAISKNRRAEGERSGGFPGAQKILAQIPKNVSRLLVGLLPEGRAPIREGAQIQDTQGHNIGEVTSGGFSPSLGKPICMGFVDIESSAAGCELTAVVRNKPLPVTVTKLPFVQRNYYRV